MAGSYDRTSIKDDGTQRLDQSAIHRLRKSEQRRHVIRELATADGTLTLDELADAVIAASDGPGEGRRDVRIGLHHVHLPLLDDTGVVDYDAENNLVQPRYDVLEALDR